MAYWVSAAVVLAAMCAWQFVVGLGIGALCDDEEFFPSEAPCQAQDLQSIAVILPPIAFLLLALAGRWLDPSHRWKWLLGGIGLAVVLSTALQLVIFRGQFIPFVNEY